MSAFDYLREPGQLADVIDSIVFRDDKTQIGEGKIAVLAAAMLDLRGMGPAAAKRKAELQAEAKREGLHSADIVLRNLTFSDVHAYINRGDCPDMTAEGEQVLTVYYASLEDDEGPYIEVRHVAPDAPLIVRGEGRDLVIGAGADILEDLVKDRQDEIKGKVMDAIRMLAGEARVDVAMAEAA